MKYIFIVLSGLLFISCTTIQSKQWKFQDNPFDYLYNVTEPQYVAIYESYYDNTRYLEYEEIRNEYKNSITTSVCLYKRNMTGHNTMVLIDKTVYSTKNNKTYINKKILNNESGYGDKYILGNSLKRNVLNYEIKYQNYYLYGIHNVIETKHTIEVLINESLDKAFSGQCIQTEYVCSVLSRDNKLNITKQATIQLIKGIGEISQDAVINENGNIIKYQRKLIKVVKGNIYNIDAYSYE